MESVRSTNALPHTLRYEQLAAFHVPFDELLGGAEVESELAHWLTRRGRVTLIGPSGSGKSSALAWALSHNAPESVIPLRIPVALADDDTIQSTAGFARHLIHRVLAAARLGDKESHEIRTRSADVARRREPERRRSARVGLRAGFSGELAREVSRAGDEFEEQIDAGEVVEALQRLVELFRAREHDPVLVLDDTDTWIARPHDAHPAQLANAFFSRNVRMLVSEIDCGFAVAVHTSYLHLPAYREVAPRLEQIRVPQLPNPASNLATILTRRLEASGLGHQLDDVFAPAAIAALARLYEDLPDVRRAIATAAGAVRLTLEDNELERVTPAAVRAAAAERTAETGGS